MRRVRASASCAVAIGYVLAAFSLSVSAQDAPEPAANEQDLIALNFPENVELKVLVEYVSQRLGTNILYDEQIGNKRLTIQAPSRVPVDSLSGLLNSALKMKGLAMIEGEQPGWKRIVQVNDLTEIAGPPVEGRAEDQGPRPTPAVTRVFDIRHADPQQADQVIKPFLTQPGGNSIVLPEQRILIVTDYATNMQRVAKLVALVDQPGEPVVMRFVPVEHLEATPLAAQVTQLLSTKAQARGAAGEAAMGVEILSDPRTNQLILIGTPERVEQALSLVESLDVALGLETKVYAFEAASPQRVDQLIKELIGELAAKRLYKSAIDQEAGLLIVTATPQIHQQLALLKEDLDQPDVQERSPVHFYKLENATAIEVLETIRAIEGDYGLAGLAMEGPVGDPLEGPRALMEPPGANLPPSELGELPPRPPAYREEAEAVREGIAAGAGALEPMRFRRGISAGSALGGEEGSARVVADPNTNTIIVVGDPAIQRFYQQLIERLDQRRPQVLIEATLVTIDTTNGFSLGVEISRTTDIDDDGERVLTFSSFGLSEVDPDSGRLTLTPGLGFNGAVVSSDIADIVIRALKTSGRSKVISAPRILVNDNATGSLSSVTEAPFVSVNASDTVATTSFAGYAQAGTTITVTPHISEGEYLNLEYEIELNAFAESGGEGIPPPRQTDLVRSEVTIPSGQTIIVGGLSRSDESETIQRIPWLGEIPILELLGSNRSTNSSQTTLFVFIRPVILRDDQFRDLKFLSQRDAESAGLPAGYPASEPMVIR